MVVVAAAAAAVDVAVMFGVVEDLRLRERVDGGSVVGCDGGLTD